MYIIKAALIELDEQTQIANSLIRADNERPLRAELYTMLVVSRSQFACQVMSKGHGYIRLCCGISVLIRCSGHACGWFNEARSVAIKCAQSARYSNIRRRFSSFQILQRERIVPCLILIEIVCVCVLGGTEFRKFEDVFRWEV